MFRLGIFLLIAFKWSYGSAATLDYPLLLLGSELEVCSSESMRRCKKSTRFDTDDFVEFTYKVDDTVISNLSSLHWRSERAQLLADWKLLLNALKKDQTELNERQWLNVIRNTEVERDGRVIRGAELLSQSHLIERRQILQIAQVPSFDYGVLGRGTRKLTKVALKQSRSPWTVSLLDEMIKAAKRLSGRRTVNVLFLTSANDDAFSVVDRYQQMFSQLNMEANWLPLDVAFWQAQSDKSCEKLESLRRSYMGQYRRDKIYPDLHQAQIEFCQSPSYLQELLEEAHVLFVASGEPENVIASVSHNSLAREFWQKVQTKFESDKLLVVAEGDASRAFGGRMQSQDKLVTILSGASHQSLLHKVVHSNYSLQDCEKWQLCPPQHASNQLIVLPQSLGLLEFGSVDNQVSNRGRVGRMVALQADTDNRFVFGIDENTALWFRMANDRQLAQMLMVSGEGGVTILDGKDKSKGTGVGLNVTALRLHYLTRGDKLVVKNGKVVTNFADWKYRVGTNSRPNIQSGKAFRGDNFKKTLNILCQTSSKSAMLKHLELGIGHQVSVVKSPQAMSASGSEQMFGVDQPVCSFRDYYLDIKRL